MRGFRNDLPHMGREELALLNEVIAEQFGIYFPDHKREILVSRLAPRLRALHLSRFKDYYLHLQYDLAGEREHLSRLLTNNETYFFRETRQFDSLFGEAIDELRDRRDGRIRCLSAGCSSGEEPYTLNIYKLENRYRLAGAELEIDAFDLDPDRLALAGSAEYGLSSLRALGHDQIARYFSEADENIYRLREPYREGVSFRAGNIVQVETFRPVRPYDVVFCRNALIYFSERALHRAVKNFAKVLRPEGLLFLGHAESIIGFSRHFETVRFGACIAYRRVSE